METKFADLEAVEQCKKRILSGVIPSVDDVTQPAAEDTVGKRTLERTQVHLFPLSDTLAYKAHIQRSETILLPLYDAEQQKWIEQPLTVLEAYVGTPLLLLGTLLSHLLFSESCSRCAYGPSSPAMREIP